MKIYNVKIKDNVHEYIFELGEYIFRYSFDYNGSKKVMDKIYEEIFSLKIFPNRCPEFDYNYRVLTINNKYRVFYYVDEENMKVIISRIFKSCENYVDEI